MDNFKDELKRIFPFDKAYLLMLLFFIVMFATLIYHELHTVILAFFFIGIIVIPLLYQAKIREIAELKMKVLYVKTKLSSRIEDFEKILKDIKNIEVKLAIEQVLAEIKIDSLQEEQDFKNTNLAD